MTNSLKLQMVAQHWIATCLEGLIEELVEERSDGCLIINDQPLSQGLPPGYEKGGVRMMLRNRLLGVLGQALVGHLTKQGL